LSTGFKKPHLPRILLAIDVTAIIGGTASVTLATMVFGDQNALDFVIFGMSGFKIVWCCPCGCFALRVQTSILRTWAK